MKQAAAYVGLKVMVKINETFSVNMFVCNFSVWQPFLFM
jgi:hypothetical protein